MRPGQSKIHPSFHAVFPSHARSPFSVIHPSIILCLRDSLRDSEKGLSQDESFHSNWGPRRKGKCRRSLKALCTSVSCLEYCLLFISVFLFKVRVFFGGTTDVFCITVPDPSAKPEYEEMCLPGALCSPREAVVMENENSLDVDSPLATGSFWTNQAQRNVVCTRSQPSTERG